MFAYGFIKSRTARSFGGLRMTMMGGSPRDEYQQPRDDFFPFYCHPEASEGSGCYIPLANEQPMTTFYYLRLLR